MPDKIISRDVSAVYRELLSYALAKIEDETIPFRHKTAKEQLAILLSTPEGELKKENEHLLHLSQLYLSEIRNLKNELNDLKMGE